MPLKFSISVSRVLTWETSHERCAPSLEESKLPLSKRKTKLSTVVLPVLVFRTKHYYEDIETGKNNKKDYLDFVNKLEFNKLLKGNRTIYHKTIHDCDVYTFYEEIDLL